MMKAVLLACLVLFAGLSACRAESDPVGEASCRHHATAHGRVAQAGTSCSSYD